MKFWKYPDVRLDPFPPQKNKADNWLNCKNLIILYYTEEWITDFTKYLHLILTKTSRDVTACL